MNYIVTYEPTNYNDARYITSDETLAALIDPDYITIDGTANLPPLPPVKRLIAVAGLNVYSTTILVIDDGISGYLPTVGEWGFFVRVPYTATDEDILAEVRRDLAEGDVPPIYNFLDLDRLALHPPGTPIVPFAGSDINRPYDALSDRPPLVRRAMFVSTSVGNVSSLGTVKSDVQWDFEN